MMEFPPPWGQPPDIQTMDYRPLPGGYGHGSSTMFHWIEEHMQGDAAAGELRFPPAWGEPPRRQTKDLVPLAFNYGKGSSTLDHWIVKHAQASGYSADEIASFSPGHPSQFQHWNHQHGHVE